jgi:peptidoglycan/LPS O-acetylase OafA/YrhL
MTASTSSAAPARPPLPSLTGIRVPLAMLIFLNHSGVSTVYRSDTTNFLLTGLTAAIGEGAVGYFFALSGFVLTWSVRANDTQWSFIRRRLAKIVPNGLLTWAIGFALLVAVGDFSGMLHLIPSLLMIQSWFPAVNVIEGTDGPAWSLSVELFFYVLFPFVLPLMLKIRPELLWRCLYAVGGIAVAIPLISLLLPSEPVVFDVLPLDRFWFIAFAPPVRLLDFLIGILVARIVIEGLWKPVRPRTIVWALLGAWAVGLAVPPPYAWVAPFLLPIVLLLGTFATNDVAGATSRFGTKRMVWLGEVTFAFYVTHWLVLHYAHLILFDDARWGFLGATLFLLGCLAFTTTFAALMFKYYEQPLFRKLGRAKRKPLVPAPAAPASAALGQEPEQARPLAEAGAR